MGQNRALWSHAKNENREVKQDAFTTEKVGTNLSEN
jgi:hypothetical protein